MQAFDEIVESQTAGLPQSDVKWTHLSCTQIVERFHQRDLHVSRYHVKQMLQLRGYKKRKLVKMNDLSQSENRDEQFQNS